MVSTLILVPCKLCKTKVSVNDLRKNKEGIYVCNTCLSHSYYEKDLRSSQLRKPVDIPKQKEIIKNDDKIRYLCSSCKFSFTKPFGSNDRNCPNCGKDYSVQRKQNASALLKEVSYMDE
jgi:protein-arginine kinase activator protein McsA